MSGMLRLIGPVSVTHVPGVSLRTRPPEVARFTYDIVLFVKALNASPRSQTAFVVPL